jgi:Restriction endonuclease
VRLQQSRQLIGHHNPHVHHVAAGADHSAQRLGLRRVRDGHLQPVVPHPQILGDHLGVAVFAKMGLETRMTQASRDGGVDCVAFDNRAIFGGKVIIQAKRYKTTVPVSAVRDLFGTVHNEGASKGILVTTSGYGKASFEFAKDKPLELLSGTNLLYLEGVRGYRCQDRAAGALGGS